MDPMKDWRIKLWHLSTKLSRPLLHVAETVDDWGSQVHASWREHYRCSVLNDGGERCVLIPGPGGCGYSWREDQDPAPHWFESQLKECSWEGVPFSISRSARPSKLETLFFYWRHRDFVPVYVTYEGMKAGHRVIAWAVKEDAWMLSHNEEPVV